MKGSVFRYCSSKVEPSAHLHYQKVNFIGDQEEFDMATMVIGKAFTPLVGKCYDLRFGKIRLDGQDVYCSARIRVNGIQPSQWEDIVTGQPMDQRLTAYRVQAFREIPGP